jgi:hypothetical protein
MSKIDCVENAYQALKKARQAKLGDKAGAGVLRKTLESEYERIVKSPNYNPQTVVKELIESANERIRIAAKQRANTLLMARAENDMFGYINNNLSDNPVDGVMSYLGGIQSYKAGTRSSVASHQQQLMNAYTSKLDRDLRSAGLSEKFESGDFDDLIAKELFDISLEVPTGKATNSADAKAMAKIIKDIQEKARLRANRAGADIGKLQGYITSQTHDMMKIYKAGYEKWVNDTLELLDIEKTFGRADIPREDIIEVLNDLHKDFASGNHMKVSKDPPALAYRKKGRNIGGSLSNERFLHFKDAESSMNYNEKYGRGNIRETLFEALGGLASKTGLMERMGPNPEETLNRVMARIKDSIGNKDQKKLNKFLGSETRFRNLMRVLDGSVNVPANNMLAQYGMIFRTIQTTAKLGGAVVSAISDVALAAADLRYQGFGFLSSYNNAIVGGFNSVPRVHRKEIASMLGVFIDANKYDLTSRYSGIQDVNGKMARMTNKFFRFTGLAQWTDRMRINVSLAMSARIGAASDLNYGQLELDLKNTLNLYNLGEKEWEVIRRSAIDEGEHRFATPEGINDIPDDLIRSLYGDVDPALKRQDISDKFRAYFIDRTEHAVITPDARTTAIMRQGLQAGTVAGEAIRMIMQFKGFPIAYLQKVGGRTLYGKQQGKVAMAAEIAHILAATTILGYAAMSIKDLLKGREPRDPLAASTWGAAMLQGGGLGLYGDFILGNSNRFGGGLVSSLAGPTVSEFEKGWKILADIRDGKDPSGRVTSFISGNIPFANVFYYKWAVDYLFLYQIQEAINPGSLRRMEKRIEDENKQELMFRPSEIVPSGGLYGLNQ